VAVVDSFPVRSNNKHQIFVRYNKSDKNSISQTSSTLFYLPVNGNVNHGFRGSLISGAVVHLIVKTSND